VVQEDICNGCGYCIPACPYGVIDQRKDDGRAWKGCTRPGSPTRGSTAVIRMTAWAATVRRFLLLDEPEVYGLPPDPVVTTRDLRSMWKHVAAAAATLVGGALAAFVAGRRL
jgi:formate dehydrogenase iron-sulfur subunit